MKFELRKNLDISQLYDDIVDGDFESYCACEEIGLIGSDLTPRLMAKIFSALADEASKRSLELETKFSKGRV